MSNKNDKVSPSLLEDESRGGDTGEGGIFFQAKVVLSYIPKWLAMEGFTSMVRESMGDTEAKFFVPSRGFIKEFVEVKNHPVTPAEFWNEIDRFKRMDTGAPREYQWFTLASAGLSEGLHPLVNSLRRIRDPYDFFDDSVIFDNSYSGYVKAVEKLKRTKEDADFLFRKVLIASDLSMHQNYGKAVFKQALRDHFPYYQDLSDRILENTYASLDTFVQSRRNQTITRIELEDKIKEYLPEDFQAAAQPVRIHTAIRDQEEGTDKTELHFAWAKFFGGETRNYPPPEEWNKKLLGDLQETKNWILKHRKIRRIRLSSNGRLSASLAIGAVFSAVSGFAIDMIHQGNAVWSTDAHADETTNSYPLIAKGTVNSHIGDRLVLSISIIRDIADQVDASLSQLGLTGMPTLHIRGDQPIVAPQQANLTVREIKNRISEAVKRTGAQQIDLFIAGPAFLALFLGHRLNAINARVQCYELAGSGQYVPTCLLFG